MNGHWSHWTTDQRDFPPLLRQKFLKRDRHSLKSSCKLCRGLLGLILVTLEDRGDDRPHQREEDDGGAVRAD